MSGSPRLSGEAFAIERLRNNPNLDYETLQRDAEDAGVTIQPIQYGRARRQLGLTGATASVAPTTDPVAVTPPVSVVPIPAPPAPVGTSPIPTPPVPTPTVPTPPVPTPTGPTSTVAAAPTATRKGSPAFDFLLQALRDEPTLSYGELKARGDEQDFKIAPIMYGRAKALLGLVPVRPRGSGPKRKSATSSAPARRKLKQVESIAGDAVSQQLEQVRSVEELVSIVKQLDSERRRMRSLLEQIANSIDEALGE